jgi:hypothetical protein
VRTFSLQVAKASRCHCSSSQEDKENSMESCKPTHKRRSSRWEAGVEWWYERLEETLEKVVWCGVDAATIAEVADATRFPLAGKRSASVLSIESVSAYINSDRRVIDDDALSEKDSYAGDHESWWENRSILDMSSRNSIIDANESDGCESSRSAYIVFEDEQELEMEDSRGCACSAESTSEEVVDTAFLEDRLYHHALFNCVLVELLSLYHPVIAWRRRNP